MARPKDWSEMRQRIEALLERRTGARRPSQPPRVILDR